MTTVNDIIKKLDKLANCDTYMQYILADVTEFRDVGSRFISDQVKKELQRGKGIKQHWCNNDMLETLKKIRHILVELDVNYVYVKMERREEQQGDPTCWGWQIYVTPSTTKTNILLVIQDRIDVVQKTLKNKYNDEIKQQTPRNRQIQVT